MLGHYNQWRIGHRAGAERSQLRRERIVSAQASDFLGEVNVAFDIVAPARRRDLEDVLRFRGDPESDQPEILFHLRRVDRLTEESGNAQELERNRLRTLGQRIKVDRTSLGDSAGHRQDQSNRVVHQPWNRVDVNAALEPIAGVGRDAKLATRRANARGIERSDLEKNLGRAFRDFAVTTTNHAGDCLRSLGVANYNRAGG